MSTKNNIKIDRRIKYNIPDDYTDLFERYVIFSKNKGLTENTVINKIIIIKKFYTFLKNYDYQITKDKIYLFLNELKSDCSDSYIVKIKYCLREFFNWTFNEKTTTFSGHEIFLLIKAPKNTTIPSYYSNDELRKILNAVDITINSGRKDFLVLSFMIFLGIRISDVLKMKFENIDWSNSNISFVQFKTKKPITLPLVDEVKFPLIDYIKNERGECNSEYIIVSTRKPYKPYRIGALSDMVTRYLIKANINYDNRRHGFHSLRHSFASNLLELF